MERAEMFYQHNMGAGGWVFMAVANVVIWGLVLVFVVWLVQDLRTRAQRQHIASGASSGEILDRRLASGEISIGEYQRLRACIGESGPAQSTRPSSAAAQTST
jgi:uncharacterized membrane protein